MDNDDRAEKAYELFDAYIALLNQEFHDSASAENAHRKCLSTHVKIMNLGFMIFATIKHDIETVIHLEDTVQTIIVFTYEAMLVKNHAPAQDPLAFASATSKIFGRPVPLKTHHPLSAEQEAWLDSVLNPLDTTGKGN